MKELKKGKVYSFQLDNCDDLVTGVLLAHGDEFIMLRKISLDYFLDGITFIRSKRIDQVIRKRTEKFKEEIINSKYPKLEKVRIPNLNSIPKFFKWLAIFKCVDITLVDYYGAIFLGEIVELKKKTLTLNSLTPYSEWNGESKYKINSISIICVDTDYINSLMLRAK
jgi:hypothetical protein